MTVKERVKSLQDDLAHKWHDGEWKGIIEEHLRAAMESAVRDRDFEWWSALCLVDTIAPTPEAIKQFTMYEAELMGKELIVAARNKIINIITECLLHDIYHRPVSYREVIDCIGRIRQEIK